MRIEGFPVAFIHPAALKKRSSIQWRWTYQTIEQQGLGAPRIEDAAPLRSSIHRRAAVDDANFNARRR